MSRFAAYQGRAEAERVRRRALGVDIATKTASVQPADRPIAAFLRRLVRRHRPAPTRGIDQLPIDR